MTLGGGVGAARPALAWLAAVLLLGALAATAQEPATIGPAVIADSGLLPRGSRLDGLTTRQSRQLLAVEQAGRQQSYLVALGNMAFSAPDLMGGVARQAGISCSTCHSSGEINRDLFIPSLSAHPGSVDVSHRLFSPKADDGIANPLDIPSLRGIALTAPYGRDGRIASLREFTRNVIVIEFMDDEPSPLILDALEAYQRQFDFLPNDGLTADGRLTDAAADAARRGAVLFRTPMAEMDGQSCAACHLPSAQFTDGRQHGIGTGGAFVTPTLLNANDTAPYFHDGRVADYAAVIEHFDTTFALGIDAAAKRDLEAYLEAVGHGDEPFETRTSPSTGARSRSSPAPWRSASRIATRRPSP
jgi:cytochrome c peroxidase